MAQLSSPGVSVTVIDESFYTPAAPGTVPLIIVASEESKQNGSATGTAPGTLKINAGKVYLLTSQKDLSDTFGTPKFITDASNNPVHAGEQNEYGLQAAYSYLGVSNRAYVVRADVDLAQLNATAVPPTGLPNDGTFWLDTAGSKFGIFEWNAANAAITGGQMFTVKTPLIITDTTKVDDVDGSPIPKSSIGSVGSYAIVAITSLIKLWYKKPATTLSPSSPAGWVEVGTPEWIASWPTVQGTASSPSFGGSKTLIINNTTNTGTSLVDLVTNINTNLANDGITAAQINGKLEIYSTGTSVNITAGTAAEIVGIELKLYNAPALTIAPHTQVPQYKLSSTSPRPTGSMWIKTTIPNSGADLLVKRYNENSGAWVELSAPLYANNAAALKGLDSVGGGINLAVNALYVKTNDAENPMAQANYRLYRRRNAGATVITSSPIASGIPAQSYSFSISETVKGSAEYSPAVTVTFGIGGGDTASMISDKILTAINTAMVNSDIIALLKSSTNQITISHVNGGDFKLVNIDNDPLSLLFSSVTTANYYADEIIGAEWVIDTEYVIGNVVTDDGQNYICTVDHLGAIAPHLDTASWLPYDGYVASLWTRYTDDKSGGFAIASADEPTNVAKDGQLWYNSTIDEVDIMIHDGTTWVGYLDENAKDINHGGNVGDEYDTDPNGPLVRASKPTLQSDGTPLAPGDLWISTADLENFPLIYRFDYTSKKWILLDNSDQTTEDGILFRDARWNTTGTTADPSSIVDLLSSNFLDNDAPDPALYPKGMLLWNLRRSGYNVKTYVQDYVDIQGRNQRFPAIPEPMTDYFPNTWVSAAANQEDGSGSFGRKAQRKVVVQSLQALVNSNQSIRDEESRIFNLLACPGYSELVGELISLNTDRGLTAFVIADTPARLTPDATTLSDWGNNMNSALEDNDNGLVSYDEYMGFFYPWGYSSDNIGNNIVIPPSHMMLRTIALSDNVSYPWFAPAGTRRGGITNASAVGFIDSEGEFQSVALNNGQRDTLASIKVNPITFITGSGLVNYGQFTRARNASALDRINVARLVIYLRRQLAQLAKPYIFEPNDKITRDEIKQAAESLLLELLGQRALYDYVVVCDTSNNTPARIDRNELWLDIAIEPVKAVEFIYIPLRLKNTGEIKGLGGK